MSNEKNDAKAIEAAKAARAEMKKAGLSMIANSQARLAYRKALREQGK